MRWFRRRVDVAAEEAERIAHVVAQSFKEKKTPAENLAQQHAEWLRDYRRGRIDASARRIAENLYATYRLASIITNAPGPEERFETLDGLIAEAVEAATKIEDRLSEVTR